MRKYLPSWLQKLLFRLKLTGSWGHPNVWVVTEEDYVVEMGRLAHFRWSRAKWKARDPSITVAELYKYDQKAKIVAGRKP